MLETVLPRSNILVGRLESYPTEADVIKIISKRFPKLKIEVPGMSSMNIWMGEEQVVMRSGRVLKGLYLAGMAVAELYNTYRMGPVLGGMISSGLKVAREIIKDLKKCN